MTEWITLDGLIDYNHGLEIMESRLQKIIDNQENETVYLLEHQDVYTAGTNYKDSELLKPQFPVIYTGRGGKFTYHGPGQRTIYPLINLNLKNRTKDIKLYVRNLEQWIINTLKEFDIQAFTIDRKTGIWVMKNNLPAKIAAIGVRVKKWVTYHGIAVNIHTKLANYSGIIPCGIADFPVTSLDELGTKITMKEFDLALQQQFDKIF